MAAAAILTSVTNPSATVSVPFSVQFPPTTYITTSPSSGARADK